MAKKINNRKFYELAKTAFTNGDFSFKNLQERSCLKYWSQLTIVKLENDDKDMPVAFMFTGVVKNYGKDLTGTSLSTGELGQESDEILLDIFNAMTLKHLLYSSGRLD